MSLTLDDVLENWAAWYRNPQWDVNDPKHVDTLTQAAAVESALSSMHCKEMNAVHATYLQHKVKWTEAALFTAKQALEQELKKRKILT